MYLQGFKQQALAVSTDPEHRFELALQLGELTIAYQLAVEAEVCYYTPVVQPPSGSQGQLLNNLFWKKITVMYNILHVS